MPETSPAETLNAAASLMRERGGKATPGPWTPMVLGSEGYLVLRANCTVRERGRGRVGRFGCKDWDDDRADAEYVASMHPLVALAVADWLDVTAKEAGEWLALDMPECVHADGGCGCTDPLAHEWGCGRCGQFMNGGGCRCWDDALKVARAYLGDPDA
jgi:hypothetical protein